jgi:hypothetical protein
MDEEERALPCTPVEPAASLEARARGVLALGREVRWFVSLPDAAVAAVVGVVGVGGVCGVGVGGVGWMDTRKEAERRIRVRSRVGKQVPDAAAVNKAAKDSDGGHTKVIYSSHPSHPHVHQNTRRDSFYSAAMAYYDVQAKEEACTAPQQADQHPQATVTPDTSSSPPSSHTLRAPSPRGRNPP